MKIKFTEHALFKIDILHRHGFNVEISMIENAILSPDKIEKGYKDRLIAQKIYDSEHVLRVVYEIKDQEIHVITIYPGRIKRYG